MCTHKRARSGSVARGDEAEHPPLWAVRFCFRPTKKKKEMKSVSQYKSIAILSTISAKMGWSRPVYSFRGYCCCIEIELPLHMEIFRAEIMTHDKKNGKEAAALALLKDARLQYLVETQANRIPITFENYFAQFTTKIVEGNPQNWCYFWQQVQFGKIRAVGIDTEGYNPSRKDQKFPTLVQIATQNFILLQVIPRASTSLPNDLFRLFHDFTVTKFFCDGACDSDAISLGIQYHSLRDHRPHILNLENHLGFQGRHASQRSGLARICDLAVLAGPHHTFKKDDQGWRFFESKRGLSIRAFDDIPPKNRRYAAIDAWMTLLAGFSILALPFNRPVPPPPLAAVPPPPLLPSSSSP